MKTDSQINSAIDSAKVGTDDRVQWDAELKPILKDIVENKAHVDSINKIVAFNSTIPFTRLITLMSKTFDEAINFTPNTIGAIVGAETIVTLIADGSHAPTFDAAFKLQSGSDVFSNVAGRVHQISFWYDGTYYYYKISQSHTITLPDTAPPTILSATAIDSHTIREVYSEAVYLTNVGHSFKQNGSVITPDSLAGSGTNTIDFTFSETLTNTDTILRSYNSSTGDTIDAAGNELVTFTDQEVTNSVPSAGPVPISAVINNGTPNVVYLSFDKTLDFSGTAPNTSFSIAGHSQSGFFAWPAGNGYGIGLSPDATTGESLTLVYTPNPTYPVIATDATIAAAFTIPITNNV